MGVVDPKLKGLLAGAVLDLNKLLSGAVVAALFALGVWPKENLGVLSDAGAAWALGVVEPKLKILL